MFRSKPHAVPIVPRNYLQQKSHHRQEHKEYRRFISWIFQRGFIVETLKMIFTINGTSGTVSTCARVRAGVYCKCVMDRHAANLIRQWLVANFLIIYDGRGLSGGGAPGCPLCCCLFMNRGENYDVVNF